jgi:hypothetical protein
VLDGWRTGDPVVRRALLAALFEELHVRDGAIVGWKVRSERAAELERLMDEVGLQQSDPGGNGIMNPLESRAALS